MASVGDVPYLTGYVVSLSSCHNYIDVFAPKKLEIDLILRVLLTVLSFIAIT
jgi:hypothetical protein